MKFKGIISAAAAALALILALAGCSGGGGTEIELTDEVTGSQGASRDDVWYFDTGSVKLAPHDNFTSVSAYLGDPLSKDESPSCAYIGYDKVFVFKGFTVQTYPENGVDFVLWISLTDQSVKTPQGVGIGSTKEEVIAATGVEYDDRGDSIVYSKGKTSLSFIFPAGRATVVQYLAD